LVLVTKGDRHHKKTLSTSGGHPLFSLFTMIMMVLSCLQKFNLF
jgi:hypothetical protein